MIAIDFPPVRLTYEQTPKDTRQIIFRDRFRSSWGDSRMLDGRLTRRCEAGCIHSDVKRACRSGCPCAPRRNGTGWKSPAKAPSGGARIQGTQVLYDVRLLQHPSPLIPPSLVGKNGYPFLLARHWEIQRIGRTKIWLRNAGSRSLGRRANGGFTDEDCASFNRKEFCLDVADDFSARLQLDPVAGGHVAVDFSVNDNRAGLDLGFQPGVLTNGKVACRLDLAFDLSVNDEIVLKLNGSLDFDIGRENVACTAGSSIRRSRDLAGRRRARARNAGATTRTRIRLT